MGVLQAGGSAADVALHSGISVDPGQKVCASGIFRFLRGETATAKLLIATAYPTAAMLLGCESLNTWIAIVGFFANLHVLMPYVHRHYYSVALDRCRHAAANCRLVVDQALRLLDPEEDAKYETWAEQHWRTSKSKALFIYSTCFFLQSAWAFHKSLGMDPMTGIAVLLLIGAGYFPLAAHARDTGQHRLRHWLEAVLLSAAHLSFMAPMWCSHMTGHKQCGFPSSISSAEAEDQLVLWAGCVSWIDHAFQRAVVEWPLPITLGRSIFNFATNILYFPSMRWCAEAEAGLVFSTSMLVKLVVISVAVVVQHVAARVQAEQRKLLRYISMRQAKNGQRAGRQLSDTTTAEEDESEECSFKPSFKIHGATPADLQPDLRERLADALEVLRPFGSLPRLCLQRVPDASVHADGSSFLFSFGGGGGGVRPSVLNTPRSIRWVPRLHRQMLCPRPPHAC